VNSAAHQEKPSTVGSSENLTIEEVHR